MIIRQLNEERKNQADHRLEQLEHNLNQIKKNTKGVANLREFSKRVEEERNAAKRTAKLIDNQEREVLKEHEEDDLFNVDQLDLDEKEWRRIKDLERVKEGAETFARDLKDIKNEAQEIIEKRK